MVEILHLILLGIIRMRLFSWSSVIPGRLSKTKLSGYHLQNCQAHMETWLGRLILFGPGSETIIRSGRLIREGYSDGLTRPLFIRSSRLLVLLTPNLYISMSVGLRVNTRENP